MKNKNFCVPYKEFDITEQPLFSFKPTANAPTFNDDGEIINQKAINRSDIVTTNYKNIIRNDTFTSVGITSMKYKVLTHRSVVEDVFQYLDYKCIEVNREKSSLLLNHSGSRLWMHLVIEDPTNLSDTDEVRPQLIIMNSSDGTSSLNLLIGLFTTVCSNQMILGKTFNKYSMNHSRQINFEHLHQSINTGLNSIDQQFEILEPLKDTTLPTDEADLWINSMLTRSKPKSALPSSKDQMVLPKAHIQKISSLWSTKDRTSTANRQSNSLLSLLNTVTEHFTHLPQLSPDLKHKYISHGTSRVLDLQQNYDEELEMAIAL